MSFPGVVSFSTSLLYCYRTGSLRLVFRSSILNADSADLLTSALNHKLLVFCLVSEQGKRVTKIGRALGGNVVAFYSPIEICMEI